MKKLYVCAVLCFCVSWTAEAQQITRIAVVDLPKVYTSFFRESRAVRDFEARSLRVQSEIDRMTTEIQNLRVNLAEAQARDNQSQITRLETDINRRSEALLNYHRTQMEALETQRNRLAQSESFLNQVNDEVRFIAESHGFSMVINLRANNGIIWYSPTIDITDMLIANLRSRANQ